MTFTFQHFPATDFFFICEQIRMLSTCWCFTSSGSATTTRAGPNCVQINNPASEELSGAALLVLLATATGTRVVAANLCALNGLIASGRQSVMPCGPMAYQQQTRANKMNSDSTGQKFGKTATSCSQTVNWLRAAARACVNFA